VFRQVWAGLLLAFVALAVAPGGADAQGQGRRQAAAGAPAALDRGLFPFFPLQYRWQVDHTLGTTAVAAGGGVVFVAFTNGNLRAYLVSTGRTLWIEPVTTVKPLVVEGDRVLVTGDGDVQARRAADGTMAWQTPLPAATTHAPAARGGWALVPLADGRVVGLAGETGRIVWTAALGAVPCLPPVIEGDGFYAATRGGGLEARRVLDGTPAWRVTLDGDVTAAVAIEGHVFAATAGRWLYALDAKKGGEVRWRYRLGGSAIHLAVDEDRVVAVMLDQSVRAFKIGSGAQVWRAALSFRPAGGPVIAGASVLVTGFAPTVRVLDRRTGGNQGLYSLPVASESGQPLDVLAAPPIYLAGATLFDDAVVLVTRQGFVQVARRQFDPPATEVSVIPGDAVPIPSPPEGWVPPLPAATPPTPASPATSPPAGAEVPPSTPPKPPGR
jgi:outer membrane protein assembly factor BamB